MYKTRVILLLIILSVKFNVAFAFREYVTAAAGSWDENNTWENKSAAPTNLTYMDNVRIRHTVNTDRLKITNGGTIRVEEGGTLDANNIDLPGNTTTGGWLIIEEGATLILATANNEPFDIKNPPPRIIILGDGKILNPSPLPVTLVYFKAENSGTTVQLHWATATEENNSHITLERSNNGTDFSAIYRAPGVNSTQFTAYHFTDKQPLPGTTYYRLKQTDLDGTITYSKIIAVTNPALQLTVSNKILISQPATGKLLIRKTNGQTIFKTELNQTQEVILPHLPEGIYLLTAELNGQHILQKVNF